MIFVVLLTLIYTLVVSGEDYVHSPIQYHSQTDSGSYNFGYDTGLFGSHQFHQERKDNSGEVRGRYGYTDPNGKARIVYYKSGPGGFQIISDTASIDQKSQLRATISDKNRNQINWSEGRYRSVGTPNKPIYSRDYYRSSRNLIDYEKPIPTRTPILIRKYRHSSESSRIYLAGRDYGTVPSRNVDIPIHRVESPRPSNNPSPYISASSPISYSPRYNPGPSSRFIPADPIPISRTPARTLVAPRTYPNELRSPVPSSVYVPPRPASAPVVYSGRGIPSPSAAARRRAQASRITEVTG